MLQLQNTILEMVAKGDALQATTDRLCIEIEARLKGVVCSILRVDRGGILHPLSGPSLAGDYCAAIEGLAIGPMVGSCGSAAFLRVPIAVTDIEHDPRWIDFKRLPLAAGLKACWSSPILDGRGEVIGTFAFYYREKRGPNDSEREIVKTCVHLCAIALERHERFVDRERKAAVDALTGLPNRASFDARLSRLNCDEPGAWALLLFDLDNLKTVNDTFGHSAGDRLLQIVAARIAIAAEPDSAFRLGGDEFVVLIEGSDVADSVEAMAGKIIDTLAAPADCEGHAITTTATIGAAVVSIGDRSAETVRRNADFALYHAKETNRGGLVHYSAALGAAMTHRLDAIRDLDAALSGGRIDAYYQPIVRLDTRAIVGLEALCRLITEDGRVVPAAAFHDAMSDAHVATRLTRQMMAIVASDIRRWLDMGIPFQHVGINVSSADFHGGQLRAELTEAFRAQNVALEHVVLEVTESVYLNNRDPVVPRAIKALRAEGFLVALDDFGTGFASLTHLLTAPVDIIKIDKSFINRLSSGDASSFIIEGLIGIARNLGVRVVAEGVETETQLSQLRAFGCALGQGYLFSGPAHRDAATAMLVNLAQSPAEMLHLLNQDATQQVGQASHQRGHPAISRNQSASIRSVVTSAG